MIPSFMLLVFTIMASSPLAAQDQSCSIVMSSSASSIRFLEEQRDTRQSTCISSVIKKLGQAHDVDAVGVLASYLDFVDPATLPRPDGASDVRPDYPAVAALFQIGKPATHELLSAIQASESSIIRENAAKTYMFVYRDDLASGIRQLKKNEELIPKSAAFHCMTCDPRVHVKADGSDQKLIGNPNSDTVSVRIVDANSVEFIQKKNGTPTFTCTEIVSPDGNTKTEEFSETPTTQRVTGKALFTRVAKGPVGSHALSGSWQMQVVKNTASVGPLTTYQTTKDGLKVSADGETYEAKFDGKDYPVQGDSAHGTVSRRMIDDNTIEKTYEREGKVVRVSLEMVSEDGKSMRVASTDIQKKR